MSAATADRAAGVLVPLAAAMRSREALDAGARLAAAIGARLEGLFVEDPNLERLSALPFAREIESLTAAARELHRGAVERAFRVEAAHLARMLAESAERARVESTFQVTRGSWLAEIVAREAALTVLAPRRGGEPGPAGRGERKPVAVLFDASDAAQRGLIAASRLARAGGRELLILVPRRDLAADAAARETAIAWLAAERLAGRAIALLPTADALFAAMRAQTGSTLALPLTALAGLAIDLAVLAADAPCTVIVVR